MIDRPKKISEPKKIFDITGIRTRSNRFRYDDLAAYAITSKESVQATKGTKRIGGFGNNTPLNFLVNRVEQQNEPNQPQSGGRLDSF